MQALNRRTEVVIHLSDLLNESAREALTEELENRQGIFTAVFTPSRHHLMLVQYDRNGMSSQDVLHLVKNRGGSARLIGPI